MNLFQFINSNNYQSYNRELAKKIGLEATIFLSEIIDKLCYFAAQDKLIDGEWIYLTQEAVLDRTALSRSQQETAIRDLKKEGLIETKLKGSPPMRHFKLMIDKLLKLCNLQNPAFQDAESCNLRCRILQIDPYINKSPREEPKEESKPLPLSKGEQVDESSSSFCKDFLERVKAKKPNFSKTVTQRWHNSAKSLLKLRTKEELIKLHHWALNDSFWSKNVLTPHKLWEHLDAIEIAQQNADKGPNKRFVNEKNKSNAEPATKEAPRRLNEHVF